MYLGLGISGKVVECFSLKTGKKYALKVIVLIDSTVHICFYTACIADIIY